MWTIEQDLETLVEIHQPDPLLLLQGHFSLLRANAPFLHTQAERLMRQEKSVKISHVTNPTAFPAVEKGYGLKLHGTAAGRDGLTRKMALWVQSKSKALNGLSRTWGIYCNTSYITHYDCVVSCPRWYRRRYRPAGILPSSHFSHVLLLVFINSFLCKTAVSDMSSQCNFPSIFAEWIQSDRSCFSLGTTQRITNGSICAQSVQKVMSKALTGRRKEPNYKSKICEIISVPGQWEVAIKSISSIYQLWSCDDHVTKRKGGTSKRQLELSRPKLRFSFLYLHLLHDRKVSLSNRNPVFKKEPNCTAV